MFYPEFIRHEGEEILRLDFGSRRRQDLLTAFEASGELIRGRPLGSLLVLSVLSAHLDAVTAHAWKRHAIANRPHVRASAVVGSCFWRTVVTSVQLRERDDLMMFDDEVSALEWLRFGAHAAKTAIAPGRPRSAR